MMRKATENRGLPPSRPYHYRMLRRNDEMLDTRSRNLGIDTENYRNAPPEYASRRASQYQRALQQHYRDRHTGSPYGVRKVVRGQTSRTQGSGQQYNNQRYRRPQRGYKLNKQKGAKHKMDVAQQAVSQEKEVDEQISVTQVVVIEETINVNEIEEKTPVKAKVSPRKSKSRSPEKKSGSSSKKLKSPEKKVQKKSPRVKPDTKDVVEESNSVPDVHEMKAVEENNSVSDVHENGSEEASTSKDDDDDDDAPLAATLGNRSLRIRLSDIALKDSSYTKTIPAPEEPREDSDVLHVSNSSTGSFESLPAEKNVSRKSGKLSAEELSPGTSSKPMDKSPKGERSFQQEKSADGSPREEHSFQREPSLGRSLRSISARRPLRGSNSFLSPSTSLISFSTLSSPQSPVVDSPRKRSDKKAKSPEKLKEMESKEICEAEMLNVSTEDVTANTSCVIITETGIDSSSKKRKSRTSEVEQELKKLKAQEPEEVSTPSRSSFLSLVSSPFFLFKRAKTENVENSAISHEPVDENLEITSSPLETLNEKLIKEDSEVEVVELDESISSDTLDKEIPSEVVTNKVSGYLDWCSIM